MNANCYKTIFSKRLGALVAVGEHASGQGKATGAGDAGGAGSGFGVWGGFLGAVTFGCAVVVQAWAGPAGNALPTGGVVAQGAASINTNGAVMSINQSTAKAVLNWNSFDIGQNAKVNIAQPGADAVMLNRVSSANPSQIFGQLNANGQVVLVNPNGIVFGKDGSVSASGFTASTLGISDANFMAGNMQFERNGSTGAVVNQGSIKTTGGYVALLGASVSNEGQIETKGGTAYLAAAETVKIPLSGSGRIKLELSPSRINAAVTNSKDGTIVTQGGQVYMQAAALGDAVASIIQSGSIDTTGEQGGAVHLLADGGNILVDGSITANSTGHDDQGQPRKGGDIVIGRDEDTGVLAHITDVSGARLESGKGFVETSAAVLQADGVQVKSGKWLLDPYDIEITDSANTLTTGYTTKITTQTLQSALNNGTDVTIQTNAGTGPATNVGVDTTGTSAGTGNILVTSAIVKSTDTTAGVDPNASLTLLADKNITVNAGITSSSGALDVTMKAGQTVSGGSITIAATGTITANGGNVVLQTKGGNITSNATTKITGANVVADNTGGTIAGDFSSITQGAYSASGANGITLTGAGIAVTNKLTMMASSNWTAINSTATLLEGKTINITGNSTSSRALSFNGGASGTTIHALDNGGSSTVSGVASGIATDAATMFEGVMNVKADYGSTLEVSGTASTPRANYYQNTRGFRLQDGNTTTTDGTVTLKGVSKSSDGFLLSMSALKVNSGTLTIDATTQATGNDSGQAGFNTNGGSINVLSGHSLVIKGLAANTNINLMQAETGVNLGVGITGAAGSSLTIQGAASSYGNSNGVNIGGAIQGFNNVTILGQNLRGSNGNAVYLNSTLSATGNVLVQSNGGRIYQTANTMTAGGWLTIDNTGAGQTSLIADTTGGLNWTTATSMGGAVNGSGVVTSQGIGKSSTSQHGVFLNGTVNSTGAMYLSGSTADTVGAVANSMYTSGTLGATGGLTVDGVTPSVITSTITGGANNVGGLTKVGAGKLTLSNANTLKGVTLVKTGTLELNHIDALKSSTLDTGTSGAQQVTFAIANNTYNIGALQGADDLAIGANTISVGANNSSTTYSGVISGSGNFVKVGTGTQTLTGTNTYTGTTTINGGTLQIGAAGPSGTLGAGAVILSNNANLRFSRTVDTTISNAISGVGNVYANITTSAGTAGKLTVSNSNFNLTNGLIDLRADGDVTLNTPIVTSSAANGSPGTTFAAILVAGQALAPGDISGGNVKVVGTGNITVGTGGVAAIYSGSISGTTGTTGMVPNGSGKFRYNSDESTAHYAKALNVSGSSNTGVNIIYREAPSVDVTAYSVPSGELTYNGSAQYGTTGVSFGALQNGDSTAVAFNNTYLQYAYNNNGDTSAKNAGAYTVTASGLVSNLGYVINYKTGSLVIGKANVVLKGGRTYNGSTVVSGSDVRAEGVADETFSLTGSGTVGSANVQYLNNNVTSQALTNAGTLSLVQAQAADGPLISNYNLSLNNSAFTIIKANLVLTGSRAYNGGTAANASDLMAQGVGNEYFTLNGTAGTVASKNVQYSNGAIISQALTSLGGLTLGGGNGGAIAGNYNSISTNNSAFTINQANLSKVTASKTYDGFGTVKAAEMSAIEGVNGETFTASSGTATISDKNVVTANKTVTDLSGLVLSGNTTAAVSSNYNLSTGLPAAGAANSVTINKLQISGAIAGVTTNYGSNAATGSVNLIGVIGTDQVTASGAVISGAAFSSSGNLKAGTYVQTADGALGGIDAGNYSFGGTSSANYVVNKLAVTSQIADVSTTYGTAAKTGVASLVGTLSGDKVNLASASGTLQGDVYSTSGQLKAGTYKQFVSAALTGADADNYTAAPTTLSNYVVSPKAITATVTAADKVYDGSNVATMVASSADVVKGDVVVVQGVTGTFASKNVARDSAGNVVAQTVTASGTSAGLGGADGANYTLSNSSSIASTTAKITPKDLIVSGITAADKVYDGSTTAAISSTNAALAGVVSGDSVSVSTQTAVGNFASKNVAFDGGGAVTSQAVQVSGLSLTGGDAGNYTVTDRSGAAAKVLQRALSITGSVAQDKAVDGTTQAQVTPGTLGNLVAGESLVVTATGQFADAEVGSNKAVATQYALANGNNGIARNYTLASEVLRAAILAATRNPVQPIVAPSKPTSSSRVVVAGSSSSGAALGVSGDEEVISREECSVLNPEKCECQESTIAGVEMCFAPGQVANNKE